MALFEIDPQQFEELTTAIRELSDNIGKWQAQQTAVIQSGLIGLTTAITGADVKEIQQQIDALTQTAKIEADAFEQAKESAQPPNQSNEGA